MFFQPIYVILLLKPLLVKAFAVMRPVGLLLFTQIPTKSYLSSGLVSRHLIGHHPYKVRYFSRNMNNFSP